MGTATAARPSRSTGKPATDFLKQVQTKGQGLPSRLVVHGVEGVGKTSFAAAAPDPIFLMSKGETGLTTLIDAGRLDETPHFPECQSWDDVIGCVQSLIDQDHKYRTLIVDTLNGCERLCHEYVCERDYKGDWSDKGFTSYMQGFEVSLADWRRFLNLLDELRSQKVRILALVHTKIAPFRNPEGSDFDRYAPDLHHKTWSLTHKWADVVMFANYETEVLKEKGSSRPKGRSSRQRTLYTERHAAFDAKNRLGLPEEIDLGASGVDGWANFQTAAQAARKAGA